MRRFIASLTGRIVSHVVILAMVMPFFSLALLTRAGAQVTLQPTWAVTEFKNRKSPGTKFGQTAAESVAGELVKTNSYDVLAQEQIARIVKGLGLTLPLEGSVNLLRVGAEARAVTIVTGDIVDYRIDSVSGGKQARVALRMQAFDVASGLSINGAAVLGESTIRSGDVTDETLVNDAIGQAAVVAVKQMQSRNLPVGTVLNTTGENAIINQGNRVGFKSGQKVIIKRGRQQVGTATIADVEPDQSNITVLDAPLGVKPGDKVIALYQFDDIDPVHPFTAGGGIHYTRAKTGRGGNTNLVTTVLVLGVLLALLAGPEANGQGAVSDVTAEPEVFPYGTTNPSVYVSWSPNGFAKGNANRFQWQIWRHDFPSAPVLVVPGVQISGHDTITPRTNQTWSKFDGTIGGTTCVNATPNDGTFTGTVPGVIPGTPYFYSNELCYSLSSLDLPGDGTTTSSGGTTTATTCYFLSARVSARGTATPLNPAVPTPVSGGVPGLPYQFNFQNSAGPTSLSLEYVIQVSKSQDFAPSVTYTFPSFRLQGTGPTNVTTPSSYTLYGTNSPLPSSLRTAGLTMFWRVGSRNPSDRPGPIKDPATRLRYIFGTYSSYKVPGTPPPPPG